MANSGGVGSQRGTSALSPLTKVGSVIQFETVQPGETIGVPVDGAAGQPVRMTGKQLGENARFNTQQSFNISPAGGAGVGGVYTSVNFPIDKDTTQVILTSTASSSPASPVEIAGFGGEEGQDIVVRLDSGTGPHHVVFLHGSGIEPTSSNQIFCPDAGHFILSGTRSSVDMRKELFDSASASLRWMPRAPVTQEFQNKTTSAEFDVCIRNSASFEQRQLQVNDINSPIFFIDAIGDADDFKTGDLVEFPANSVIVTRGTLTWPTDTRFEFGANCIIKGFSRENDQWIVNTAGQPAFKLKANADSFEMLDFGLIQNSATGDLFAETGTNTNRLTISRFIHVGNGGRGFDFSATNINTEALNITGVSHNFTLTAGGSVMVIDGAFMGQSVGGSGNKAVDLGSSSNKWTFVRFSDMVIDTDTGGVGISGATANGNMTNSASTFRLRHVQFQGSGTNVTNLTEDDLQGIFEECTGVKNSHYSGGYSMTGNTTATGNSAVSTGVFVKIAGTTVEDLVHRLEQTANNELTTNRLNIAPYKITVNIAAKKSGAAKHLCSFGVFADKGAGFALVSPAMSIEVSNVLNSVPVNVLTDLDTGDKIEIRVANNTSATDIIAEDLVVLQTQGG